MPYQINNATTTERVDNIAGFLRDLGYDLGMSYGESSGATDAAARQTFVNFGYDDNTLTKRYKYNTSGWTNTLHSEIAAGRPVYYSGCSDAVCTHGHAFVLDGYDAGKLYHVNLGWGAGDWTPDLNGNYFYIDTITPTGHSNYSHWQVAIWGIQPTATYCTALSVNTPVETPKFCIAQAGIITVSGVNINNVTDGRIYSEEGVKLETGTQISNGSNVQIAIKPIPCNPPVRPSYVSKKTTTNQEQRSQSEELKYATNYAIGQLELNKRSFVSIYSIDGKLLLNEHTSIVTLTNLSNGVYVIRAIAEDGTIYQSRILIQK